MSLKRVLVLLAMHNGEKYLKPQILSIMNQEKVQVDLLVSNDQSSDNSVQIVNTLKKKYKKIHLINTKRQLGPAQNFYFLFSRSNLSKYDYIALSDQDDIWPNFRISRALDVFDNEKIDGYSSDVISFENNCNYKLIKKSYNQKEFDYFFEPPGPGNTFIINIKLAKFLKKIIIEKKIDFAFHDWLFYAVARYYKFKWYIDDQPNLFYRQHSNNFIGANIGFYAALKRINRVLKGNYLNELTKLHKILKPNKPYFEFSNIIFYILNFDKCRRNFIHSIYLIFFLVIMLFQENKEH